MTSFFINIFMLSSIFLLASCQNDVKDVNTSESSSTFVLGEVKAVSFATYASDSNWPDLKDRASVDLSVCIMDRKYLDKVVGEDFIISSDLDSSEDPSNGEGCITWTEKFEFDSTVDETFFKINGSISGESNYKGEKAFKIAVNPWSEKVIDLDFGSAQKLSGILSDTQTKSFKNQLEIENYDISVNEVSFEQDGSSTSVNLTVSTKPQFIRKELDGTKKIKTLSGGDFNVEFYLFQRSIGTGDRILIASNTKKSSINEDGKLETGTKFLITDTIESQSESVIELIVKTSPSDAPLKLGVNEGLIRVKSLLEDSSGKLTVLPIQIEKMKRLSDQYKSRKSYKSVESTKTKHGFLIDGINGRTVTEFGENYVPGNGDRHIRTEFSLSLVHSLIKEGINSSFDIEVRDIKNNSTVETYVSKNTKLKKNSGELIFTPTIDYGEEFEFGYREYEIILTGTKAPFKGIEQKRTVYLNPRARDGGFLLDGNEYDEAPGIEKQNQPKIKVEQFRFDFARNINESYKVNKNLDLISKRVVTLEFNPTLEMRHNSQGTEAGPVKLPNGKYKVSFMVMSPINPFTVEYSRSVDLKDFYAITGGQSTGPVTPKDNGTMTVDIELPILFEDRQFLALNSIGLIYIESMNENSIFQPGYMIGKIRILENNGVIKPLFDSRLKTEDEVVLQQSNKEIARNIIKNVKEFENKLSPDHSIESQMEQFKTEISKNVVMANNKPIMVPVIDHKNFSLTKKPVKMHIAESEESIIRKYKLNMSQTELQDLIINYKNMPSEVAQELCNLFYDPKEKTVVQIQGGSDGLHHTPDRFETWYGIENKRCRKDPVSHMSFKELRFMEKILSQPKDLNINVRESHSAGTESEAYFSSKGSQQSKLEGVRESAFERRSFHGAFDLVPTLFGPLKFYGAAGADVGVQVDRFTISQDMELLSNQRRIINQVGQKFLLDTISLAFEARLRKCIVVGAKYVRSEIPTRYIHNGAGITKFWNWMTGADNSVIVSSPDRHFVCLNGSRIEVVPEEWWFVRLAVSKNATGDGGLMRNSRAGAVIRGKNAYKEFREINLEEDKALIFNLGAKEEVIERYKNYLEKKGKGLRYKQRIGTGFPGLHE